jgi:hypothetical protein
MHAQASGPSAAVADSIERAIMQLLLSSEHPAPWSEAELEREIGNSIATQDALANLHSSGLIHRYAGMFSASRTARRMDELGA